MATLKMKTEGLYLHSIASSLVMEGRLLLKRWYIHSQLDCVSLQKSVVLQNSV